MCASRYYLAVDIGASGGRHILGWVENGRICTEEMYRFENGYTEKDGRRVWDVDGLFSHILAGMKRCGEAGRIPASVGVDTWAVDYVLLDGEGRRLGDAVAYRDVRTAGMDALVEETLPFAEQYRRCGIQKLPFNTVYQLMAEKVHSPQRFGEAKHMLMLPDYFHYRLCGAMHQEYTNATSTALVNTETRSWDMELIEKLGYPAHLFRALTPPGTPLGVLSDEIVREVGYSCEVVLPATHDTASAYMAVPARDERAVYLSSGTWSLLGIESIVPVINEKGCAANFTNEGGYGYQFRVLKNIMGLWMIQSLKRQSGQGRSYAELEALARACEDEVPSIDVNDETFLAPDNMWEAVRAVCAQNGDAAPESLGAVMKCVYYSLAACYKDAVANLENITGRQFTSINIVGGGCKDSYLNELTAKATGLPVYAGPAEGTTLGNLVAQMIASGEYENLTAARAAIRESFAIQSFEP